jgi:Icc-related predicted phosphoesterase
MKIAAVADLHGRWSQTPPKCDVLLVAGDLGPIEQVQRWLDSKVMMDPSCVIACAGNHDWEPYTEILEPGYRSKYRDLPWTFLQDQAYEVDGTTFYGTPWTPPFLNWAFMLPEEELAQKWEMIPEEVDVLLTHGPPEGLRKLDLSPWPGAGSPSLHARCEKLAPLLHVFGHIHENRGSAGRYSHGGIWANVSVIDGQYMPYEQPVETFQLWT